MCRWLAALLAVRTASAAGGLGLGTVPLPEISDYVVILDAGSTGTRAQAFHYPQRVLTPSTRDFIVSKPLSLPKPLFFIDANPGISSFKDDQNGLYRYLQDFTWKVAKRLRHHDRGKKLSEVPIYLGATAGMRNLAESVQHHLFVPIREALRDSPFYFGHATHARVLSGEEESAYGWLTVNYYHASVCADPAATVGSLDMGGESTEVAFIPDEPSIMAGLFPMHFGQLPGAIHLYTHSFMHFGLLSAFQYVTKQLLHGASVDRLEHPCLPQGLHWHVQEGIFGVSTDGHAERSRGPLELVGTGDYARCEEATRGAIIEAPCTQPPCSFLGVYQPVLGQTRFYMGGEFGKIFHLFAPTDSKEPPLRELRSASQHFCGRPLHEQEHTLKRAHSAPPSEPALTCFLACYAHAFLVKGLGFEVDTGNLLVDARKHDWPQGAAIYHVNFYPYRVQLDADSQKQEDRTQELAADASEANATDAVDEGDAIDQPHGEVLSPLKSSSSEVLLRGAKHGKRRKALHAELREQKKELSKDEKVAEDLAHRLDRVIAHIRKKRRRVKQLKRSLGKKHGGKARHASRPEKHGGKAKHSSHKEAEHSHEKAAPSEAKSSDARQHAREKAGRSESRGRHVDKAEEDAATTPPLRRAVEVDAAALVAATLVSGACLLLMTGVSSMACCKGQAWRRPAQEPLLAG